MYIYTPAGYDKNMDKKYPVIYIMHGGGEDARGWVQQGRSDIILDNLIAEVTNTSADERDKSADDEVGKFGFSLISSILSHEVANNATDKIPTINIFFIVNNF
jgi:predicted peptidase